MTTIDKIFKCIGWWFYMFTLVVGFKVSILVVKEGCVILSNYDRVMFFLFIVISIVLVIGAVYEFVKMEQKDDEDED